MIDIILVGGGSHCKSVIDTIQSRNIYNPIGIVDTENKVGTSIQNIPIIGTDDELGTFYQKGINKIFITLGSIGRTSKREKIYKTAKQIGFDFPTIIDSSAILSKNVILGEGTFIGKGSIINTSVHIGNNCIINSGVIIDHDCKIGDFVHLAPGTTLSGGVKISNSTHIGTNSTIIQNIKIGNNTLIGAGSVVVRDIEANVKAYGNPCRIQ